MEGTVPDGISNRVSLSVRLDVAAQLCFAMDLEARDATCHTPMHNGRRKGISLIRFFLEGHVRRLAVLKLRPRG